MGENTGALVQGILERKKHPEAGYRSCLGIISLSKKYPKERVEAASARVLVAQAFSYQSLKSVLKAGLDRVPVPEARSEETTVIVPVHQNIRGRDYYQQESLPLSERNGRAATHA